MQCHYKTNSLIISLIIRLELVVVRTIGLIVRTIRLTVRIPAFRGTREADNSTISLQPDTSRGIVLVVRSALSWPRAAKLVMVLNFNELTLTIAIGRITIMKCQ